MGISIQDHNQLIINALPLYGSLNVEKDSKGIGGAIHFNSDFIDFFDTVSTKTTDQNGKLSTYYCTNRENIFCFKKENLLAYLYSVKDEYKENILHTYKKCSRSSYINKEINEDGWNERFDSISNGRDYINFDIDIKKTDDDSKRCYLKSETREYKDIVAYTIIPKYTTLIIEKNEEDGHYRYVFLLEYREPIDIATEKNENYNLAVDSYQKDSGEKIYKKAKKNGGKAITRAVTTVVYERDPYVAAHVKERAKGICDLCNAEAPFIKKNRLPYLEEHHVIPLSKGGEDSINNAVALCPNCHRKMHVLDLKRDINKLIKRIEYYKKSCGLNSQE